MQFTIINGYYCNLTAYYAISNVNDNPDITVAYPSN